MRGKHYTVMVVPHTRARFSKFRVSASFVAVIAVIAFAAIVSTGLLPVYIHLSAERAGEITNLREENRELRLASTELDQALSSIA